jgi:competence protein ComEA
MKRGLSQALRGLIARIETGWRTDWLRPKDQPVIAVWLVIAAAGIAVSWVRGGGPWGGLVAIDEAPAVAHQDPIDINRAEWPELTLLPGISRIMAERIVQNRREEGPYRSIEDLCRVPGVGPKTVARLRPFIDARP